MDKVSEALRAIATAPEALSHAQYLGEWPSHESVAIQEVFEESADLSFLDDTMQVIGSGAYRFARSDLAAWAVRRLVEVGADQTIEELDQWLKAESIEAYEIVVIAGIPVDAVHELGAGVAIMPTSAIPVRSVRERVVTLATADSFELLIGSALVRKIELEKVHYHASDGPKIPHAPRDFDDLTDAWHALTLATRYGPQRLAGIVATADDVPSTSASSWIVYARRQLHHFQSLTEPQAAEANRLHDLLLNSTIERRRQLRVPIERLNSFSAEKHDVAQSAIELRIAMEALFLDDQKMNELRYRLGLRAALLLETDAVERRRVFRTVRKAYDLGSTAVHTGTLTGTGAADAGQHLAEAAELTFQAAILLTENPVTDWESLTLGVVADGDST